MKESAFEGHMIEKFISIKGKASLKYSAKVGQEKVKGES